MKRLATLTGLFFAGAALAFVTDVTIYNLWVHWGWMRSANNWLINCAVLSPLSGYWMGFWLNLPFMAVLLLLGAIVGRRAGPGRWLGYALVSGLGYLAYTLAWDIWGCFAFIAAVEDPVWAASAVRGLWASIVWHIVSAILLLLVAWRFGRAHRTRVADGVKEGATDDAAASSIREAYHG